MENSRPLELLKTRTFSEKISDAFVLIRVNFGVLFKAHGFISLPIIILFAALFVVLFRDYFSLLTTLESGPFADVLVRRENFARYSLFMLFAYLAATPVVIVTLAVVDRYSRHPEQKVTFEEVWSTVRQKFLKLFLLRLLIAPLAAMAYFTLFMPMGPSLTPLNVTISILMLFPGMAFITLFLPADLLILQHNYPVGKAIRRSFTIMGQNFWSAFGATVGIALIYLSFSLLMLIPGEVLKMVEELTVGYREPSSWWGIFLTSLRGFNTIAGFVLFAIPIAGIGIQYFTIRETVARAGIMERIRSIGVEEQKVNIYVEDEQY
ncbi:MAG: hypothetical protein AAGN35_07335 [Bacteroidota bacterium]